MPTERSYLGVPIPRPRVAVFEFTGCGGCQLQLLNREAGLLDFLALVDIVDFREAMSNRSEDYEIALVAGSITREAEASRLKEIRQQARLLVSLGSCACFGGVNRLKDRFADQQWVSRQVYGARPVENRPVRPLADLVPVDLEIYGCPINKEEVERLLTDLVLGRKIDLPRYPVCMECTAGGNTCLYDLGEPCLGPITRAGCNAWCPASRMGCWGCRGPADDANVEQLRLIMKSRGFSEETIMDRLECFGGFVAQPLTDANG